MKGRSMPEAGKAASTQLSSHRIPVKISGQVMCRLHELSSLSSPRAYLIYRTKQITSLIDSQKEAKNLTFRHSPITYLPQPKNLLKYKAIQKSDILYLILYLVSYTLYLIPYILYFTLYLLLISISFSGRYKLINILFSSNTSPYYYYNSSYLRFQDLFLIIHYSYNHFEASFKYNLQ